MTDKQIIIKDYFNILRDEYNRIYCIQNIGDPKSLIKAIREQNKYIQAKEQECEELKAEIKHYKQIAQYHGNLSVKYTNKSAKYKQTLTEIKDIAEKEVKRAPDGETFSRPEIKQILQKISECEVEDDNA